MLPYSHSEATYLTTETAACNYLYASVFTGPIGLVLSVGGTETGVGAETNAAPGEN